MTMGGKANRAVTQGDVARHAGVSRSMVSYVLNGGPRPVAPETRLRIIHAIDVLGYRPNKFAQNLIKSKSDSLAERQLGIIMSDVFMFRRPYYADIIAGIHNTAHREKHHIRFIRVFNDLKDPLLFNELIHREEISGLILLGLDQSIHSDQDMLMIHKIRERIPNTLCIEWELEGLPSISFNRQDAAYKATKHLLQLGKKNIVYMGPPDNRILGFQQALMEFNLYNLSDETNRVYLASDLSVGRELALKIVQSGNIPEGIIGGTDEVSIGVLRGLISQAIKVPDQIALVSIDNTEMSEYTNPPLSTVNVNTNQMGTLAVETLITRAKNPGYVPATILLPTHLIIRESCAGLNDK